MISGYCQIKCPILKHCHDTLHVLCLFCSSQGRFRLSRYTNVDFTVILPEGMDVCDIGTLTVWCQPFDIVFGFVEFPRNTFVSGQFIHPQLN